jgi:hypothetical protein
MQVQGSQCRGPIAIVAVHGLRWLRFGRVHACTCNVCVCADVCACVYIWLKLHTPMLCASAVVAVVISYSLEWFPPPVAEIFAMAINALWDNN